jgi:hypothetical protein
MKGKEVKWGAKISRLCIFSFENHAHYKTRHTILIVTQILMLLLLFHSLTHRSASWNKFL